MVLGSLASSVANLSGLLRTWSVQKAMRCQIHLTTSVAGRDDKRMFLKSMPKKEEGAIGEKLADLDKFGYGSICEFPDVDTPNRLFNGVKFSDIPILFIKCTKNNTIAILSDHLLNKIDRRSCNTEGFKNCRKKTTVAGQAVGLAIGQRALRKFGVDQIRIMIRGLGPGRAASIKGLEMSGIKIISITDHTRVSWNPPRPPLPRSL